ncbi:B3/B4 domain-containing protein [Nocardiopsis potens]|uniref:B3/B4 domain-containing protein n=1 Tax=Nocardiopsis potens TaxID=1246458 RepID=UPI000345F212|nr:phenylalanine--tRNA ligase beta subunit-related protein [Nocardiopsis potens]
MISFSLSLDVSAAFPGTLIALVTADVLRVREPWPRCAAALEDLERKAAEGAWAPAGGTDPRIRAWHAAYRSFGTDPNRVRPGVEALGRRLAEKGRLPRVNPAVDACSAVSVRSGLPARAFDLDAIARPVEIRFAEGTEEFTPLGEPGTVRSPAPGEVVYASGTEVLTRHWNHRDARRTRVTEDSEQVVFVLETVDAARDGERLREAVLRLEELLAPHADEVEAEYLAPSQPQVMAGF